MILTGCLFVTLWAKQITKKCVWWMIVCHSNIVLCVLECVSVAWLVSPLFDYYITTYAVYFRKKCEYSFCR